MNYRIRMRNLREDSDLTQKQLGSVINKSRQRATATLRTAEPS